MGCWWVWVDWGVSRLGGDVGCCQTLTHHHTPQQPNSQNNPTQQAFQGRGGRAFLLDRVVNAVAGPPEDRLLMTGVHTVADLCCAGCKALLGWKYVSGRGVVVWSLCFGVCMTRDARTPSDSTTTSPYTPHNPTTTQQEKAHEPSQRYKEGKFILERVRLYHEAEDGEGGAHNEGWLAL